MKTLIPKVSEGIFDVIAEFNKTDDYVLYYHSGRKTIRAFRRKDGKQIANYRLVKEKVLKILYYVFKGFTNKSTFNATFN